MNLLLHYGLPLTLALYAAGALSALLFGSRASEGASSTLSHVLAAAAALAGLSTALSVIASKTTMLVDAGGIGLMQHVLTFRIDPLAAFFLATISTVVFAASVYGIAYQKQFLGIYRLSGFGFFYNLFLAGMTLVVTADNGVLFLFAWELMAIASYFLVVFERREAHNVTAGGLYILISQLGAAFLFATFVILYGFFGTWDFEVLRAHTAMLPALMQNVVLLLALVGFASKAGVIPLHIWLPEAHPAAPSHVSAIMSGVMIKTAIFMIVRFFVEFFPASSSWGFIILALGAISSLLGVLYALSEHDIKRLLAFHSVENIGIILLGIGASVSFFAYHLPVLGYLALSAALYHTVNHALFKSLLFLSAGSVVHATGTRNMEEYGGLIKAMPWTAFFFLIGAVAISGLPPFNGFVSEWLTFQSLFAGIAGLPLVAKAVFLLGAASLAFTGGLAAACFVKAFGTTFLARARGHVSKRAHEASWLMTAPMALLALLTLVFGVGASFFAPIFSNIAAALRGTQATLQLATPAQSITVGAFSSLSMLWVAVVLLLAVAATYLYTRLMARGTKRVVSRTWDCGYPLSPRMEITATGFSRSLIVIFRGLLRPSTQKSAEYHDSAMRYFAKSRMVHMHIPNLYRTYLYDPAALFVEKSALRARRIQTGNLNVYLLYMLLTVAVLLLWTLH
jgi:hydrogenase-4 component B